MKYIADKPRQNCLFLTGDLRQKVFAKHHDTRDAGMNFAGKSRKMKQTYRCTQQILRAALEVAKANKVETDDDVEVVDPVLSRFEGLLPQVICVENVSHVDRVATIVDRIASQHPTDRIAVITENQELLDKLRDRIRWRQLLRNDDPSEAEHKSDKSNDNVISRMNAVKGFEFDSVIVADLSERVLPNPERRESEWWRDAALLYSALTRARTRLYITYQGNPSRFLECMRGSVEWIPS